MKITISESRPNVQSINKPIEKQVEIELDFTPLELAVMRDIFGPRTATPRNLIDATSEESLPKAKQDVVKAKPNKIRRPKG